MQRTNSNTANGLSQPPQPGVRKNPISPAQLNVSNKPILDLKELQAFEEKLWDYQRQLSTHGVKYGSLQDAWTKFIHQYNATCYELEKKRAPATPKMDKSHNQ